MLWSSFICYSEHSAIRLKEKHKYKREKNFQRTTGWLGPEGPSVSLRPSPSPAGHPEQGARCHGQAAAGDPQGGDPTASLASCH